MTTIRYRGSRAGNSRRQPCPLHRNRAYTQLLQKRSRYATGRFVTGWAEVGASVGVICPSAVVRRVWVALTLAAEWGDGRISRLRTARVRREAFRSLE
jgi:hypothetical protein